MWAEKGAGFEFRGIGLGDFSVEFRLWGCMLCD